MRNGIRIDPCTYTDDSIENADARAYNSNAMRQQQATEIKENETKEEEKNPNGTANDTKSDGE